MAIDLAALAQELRAAGHNVSSSNKSLFVDGFWIVCDDGTIEVDGEDEYVGADVVNLTAGTIIARHLAAGDAARTTDTEGATA